MPEDKTGTIAKRAMLAFAVTLLLALLLVHWLMPGLSGAIAPLSKFSSKQPLPGLAEVVGKLVVALLVAAIAFSLLLLWNFLFQIANPDSIIRRQLDSREPESPLPHADQLPLEGD